VSLPAKPQEPDMTFLNFTPHTVRVLLSNGGMLDLHSSGVARVASETQAVGHADLGGSSVALTTQSFGVVTDLPDPSPGVMLVVSGMVRAALPHRTDVVSPGGLQRDALGRVTHCTSLVCNPGTGG